MARPRKVKFPVTLEVWLRLILRKKRPEDRMRTFREWRRFSLRAKFKREPTDQEIEEDIKLFREHKFDVPDCAWGLGESLRDFVLIFHKENRRKRAQTAATKRWSKKSKKNT